MDKAMRTRIHRIINRTWQTIGDDCVQCNDGWELEQDAQVESVLDANYVEQNGGDNEAAVELRKLEYEASYDGQITQQLLAKEAFGFVPNPCR